MKIQQIYTGCLAQGAYFIEDNGEVAIIDPLREVEPYIEMAKKLNAKIKYVFETHFHADFVSGHIDLAKKTGAQIVYGPTNVALGFDAYIAKDQEVFELGNVNIKLLHTPGHTMESSCYLLKDENGKDKALFTGDTLFIGDVGRPDLAQKVNEDLNEEKLAGHLFDSLRNKIMPLNDDIIVYPAHGAGSACGKNMSKETSDTLGNQKKTNYALDTKLSKEEFKSKVLEGLTPPPGYFPENVKINIQGYESIDKVLEKGNKALTVKEFEDVANQTHALLLDTRDPQTFAQGFIPNSINIGIDGSFAVWVGTLILNINQEILIIADSGREEEVATRLARVGYDNILGHLQGGFEAWKKNQKEMDTIPSIDVLQFAEEISKNNTKVLDVRKVSEYDSGHLVKAENVPLDYINENINSLSKDTPYFIHCAGGYRSMIFASILKARGYEHVTDIKGGYKEIKQSSQLDMV